MATVTGLDGLALILSRQPKSGTVRHSTIVRVNRIAECRNLPADADEPFVTVIEKGRDGNARKSTAIATAYRKLIGDATDVTVVPLRAEGEDHKCLLVPAGAYKEAMAKVA